MSDIWVVSDLHYNHENILTFVGVNGVRIRPEFDNVNQMNECLLDSWNSVVKPGDKVYNLGDVFFGSKEKFARDWPKFNGKKNLIVGNHDDIKFLSSGSFFSKVYLERRFPGMIFTHRPIHESGLEAGSPGSGKYQVNVHGHIHEKDSPPGLFINVSVEKLNYTPIHFDELQEKSQTLLKKWLTQTPESDKR